FLTGWLLIVETATLRRQSRNPSVVLHSFSSFTRRQIRKYDRSDRSALEPNPHVPSHLHLHPLPESYVAGDVLGGFEGRRVVPGRVFVDLAANLYVVVAGDALP